MLQRIQTVYLLIVTILFILMFIFPFYSVTTVDLTSYTLSFKGFIPTGTNGFNMTFTTVWLSVLIAIIPAISFISILLYKRRMLQIRLSVFNMILMAGFYAMFFIVQYYTLKNITIIAQTMEWPIILPFISIVLTYLAIRAIGKDEALVRSLNRLR